MADPDKLGQDWDASELDAIVADYFAMLALEQAGQAYVKSHRAQDLMGRIDRTHRSVELKHMNISAALTRLGVPSIRGHRRIARSVPVNSNSPNPRPSSTPR